MLRNFFTFSRFTLFIALCISAIAAWYSVIGLTAIFAGAVIPIIIMGGILEVAKITTTVWLHKYWDRASYAIRTYLTIAVVALACLTSMGIFGLLSKAHLEQGVISGDVQSSVALLDEKIKISKENIDANRRALKQLDEAVDQVMARSTTETGADKAVQIRRSQARERTRLLQEIEAEQKKISAYNEQRAPVASQLRKVEAEVGPIKYIAALVYGDNPDTTTLERAVRWVTILIVAVFDPLAIVLILAANNSIRWEREDRQKQLVENSIAAPQVIPPEQTRPTTEEEIEPPDSNDVEESLEQKKLDFTAMTPWPEFVDSSVDESITNHTDEKQKYSQANWKTVYHIDPIQPIHIPKVEGYGSKQEEIIPESTAQDTNQPKEEQVIITDGVTTEAQLYSSNSEYVVHDGKKYSIQAIGQLHPELIVNGPVPNQILFGNTFPGVAVSGDIYTRVDVIPHKTYKFNGIRWIEIDRQQNTSYLQNVAYIQYLIAKLDSGEYDPENLSEVEQEEIQDYLKRTT